MTDHTELKRLAKAANAVTGDVSVDITISSERGPNQPEIDAVTVFVGAATPAAVLSLIAENERLKVDLKSVVRLNNENADLFKTKNDQLKADNERQAAQFKEWQASHHANYVAAADERDQLRAELAGLKTGYEAYERVNAELKAEVEGLRKDADRLQSATAFVQKLCDSAGKQPSVATGYLHDILSALGQGEQS